MNVCSPLGHNQDGLRVDAISWCSEQQRGVKVGNNTLSLGNRLFTPKGTTEILKITYGNLYGNISQYL